MWVPCHCTWDLPRGGSLTKESFVSMRLGKCGTSSRCSVRYYHVALGKLFLIGIVNLNFIGSLAWSTTQDSEEAAQAARTKYPSAVRASGHPCTGRQGSS